MAHPPKPPQPTIPALPQDQTAAREARLAAALRANLRRRKAPASRPPAGIPDRET